MGPRIIYDDKQGHSDSVVRRKLGVASAAVEMASSWTGMTAAKVATHTHTHTLVPIVLL